MTFKKVYKIDKKGNVVKEFNSVREAILYVGLSKCTFNKRVRKGEEINGYFYKLENKEPYMKKVICEFCGKEFLCQSQRITEHKHLFCSQECATKFRKLMTKPNCVCPICGTKFHIKPSQLKKSKNNYCSKECHYIAKQKYMKGNKNHQYGLKGDLNDSWTSDERISVYGYKLIRKLNHPFRNCDDFVFEHRLVAEQYYLTDYNSIEIDGKKYLKREYDVHHIDFDKLNNSPENLIVLTRSEHQKLHQMIKKKDKIGKNNGKKQKK